MSDNSPVIQQLKETVGALDALLAGREAGFNETKARWDRTNSSLNSANPMSRQKYEQELSDIRIEKKLVQDVFSLRWKQAFSVLDSLCKKIRAAQPHLNNLNETSVNNTGRFMSGITAGRARLSYMEEWEGYVPLVAQFPLETALLVPNDQIQRAQQLILRLSQALPAGSFEFIIIDPIGMGKALGVAMPLLKIPFLAKDGVLTYGDDIQAVLHREQDYIARLIQNTFIGAGVKNWWDYNAQPGIKPLPYKVIAVFGLPAQMSDSSLWSLTRLVEKGPACGVLPIITAEPDIWEDRRNEKWAGQMRLHLSPLIRVSFLNELKLKHIEATEEPEFEPQDHGIDGFFNTLAEELRTRALFVKSIEDMWADRLWTESSTEGISAPLGWTDDGSPAIFHIGSAGTPHHTLLGGTSGSGKSNLLHVLIHTLSHRYAPKELELYLLDYKEGTEFNQYTAPVLPHANLIAVESDPEYGVTVLRHLTDRMKKRADSFKKAGAADFSEYRKCTGSALARILLIIDEFQMLFTGSSDNSKEADAALTLLLRQGRSHGIHIILSTQTLRGAVSPASGITPATLTSQIACRIALSCPPEDSNIILGINNDAAAALIPAKEALINNNNGAKSGNIKFNVPYADKALCRKHLDAMAMAAADKGFPQKTKIFTGSRLPKLPSLKWFRQKVPVSGLSLFLGKSLSFESDDFTVSLEPREGMNMLIAGYNTDIQRGMALSIVRSLGKSGDMDQLIYFSARKTPLLRQEDFRMERFAYWEGMPESLPVFTGSRVVLIIDGLDQARGFQPLQIGAIKKPDSPPLQWDWLKDALNLGPATGSHVIAFCDNWKRCIMAFSNARELQLFSLRIAFNMTEDEAGGFLVTSVGMRLKGAEQGNRAAFADQTQTGILWFKPYSKTEEGR